MPNKYQKQRVRERNIWYLMRVGRRKAILKGHSPGPWRFLREGKSAIAYCTKCGWPFGLLCDPYPMETAVSGSALFYRCDKKKGVK